MSYGQSDPKISYYVEKMYKELMSPTVLDLGCGGGRMGKTVRKINPKAQLHGIDIHPDPALQGLIYNTIDVSELKLFIESNGLNKYSPELIIFTEVIEHLEINDGAFVLGSIAKSCAKYFILSAPIRKLIQKGPLSHDIHRVHYCLDDFKKMNFKYYGIGYRFGTCTMLFDISDQSKKDELSAGIESMRSSFESTKLRISTLQVRLKNKEIPMTTIPSISCDEEYNRQLGIK